MRIMLIEDHKDARDLLTDILELAGHEVRSFDLSYEALMNVDRFDPDIIVSDIALGDHSGLDVARRVSTWNKNRVFKIGLVAVSGLIRVSDVNRTLDAGFHVHVSKPINISELLLAIDNVKRMLK